MAPRMPLRLTLIGNFALWRGSQELAIAPSGQRLIALLALRDRPVGRLHVAGTLWPDYPTERSLADLRTMLWRVNQSTEHVIAATQTLLRLDVGIEVDVRNLVEFARRLTEAETLSKAVDVNSVGLANLAGELLPDWYDDWLQDEREELRQTRLHALESLARALSKVWPSRGRHPGRTSGDSAGTVAGKRPSRPHRNSPGRRQQIGGLSPIPAMPAVATGRTRHRTIRLDASPP